MNGSGANGVAYTPPPPSAEEAVPLDAPPSAVRAPGKPSLLKDILIGVGIALVVVAAVVSYFLVFRGKPDEPAAAAPPPVAKPQGAIKITEPKGATALLDGKPGCSPTPCDITGVELGGHTVSMTHPDYEIADVKVKVTGAEPVPLTAAVKPKSPGRLKLVAIGKEKYSKLRGQVEIYLNDEALALSDDGEAELPAGRRTIEIRRAGYLPLPKEVDVPAGGVAELAVDAAAFTEAKFKLTVDSTPVKGKVTVDGKEIGPAPAVVPDLSGTKSHVVVIKAEGYEEYRTTVRWKEGPPELAVTATLSKEAPAGYLIANTIPIVGVAVYIDGKKTKFTTPTPEIKLSAGAHTVTFETSAGKKYDFTFEIKAGETTRKVWTLK
jgi:hypothetical protein